MKRKNGWFSVLIVFSVVFLHCASNKMVPVENLKEGKTVRVYLKNAPYVDGLMLAKKDNGLLVLSIKDKKEILISKNKIRRIDYLDQVYDYGGEKISDAEIKKYRENKYFWGYSLGGLVIGGVGGILVGLPLWYMETGVRPYFTGGLGAIAGSIFFGRKGNLRDRERSIELIRILRQRKNELLLRQQEELKQLEEIKKQKEEMEKKLKERKGGNE
ncbi:MAG: hypothetical protein Kow00108_01140 [Calditrichia bacterium]